MKRNATLALILAVAALQLFQPQMVNPPVDPLHDLWKDRSVDPRVAQVLRRACADCHSHETTWPWYSRISPISWIVARHVNDGRAKLNLSKWSPSIDQVEEIYDSVARKKMPLPGYDLMHPGARLSQTDRDILRGWADGALAGSSAENSTSPKLRPMAR